MDKTIIIKESEKKLRLLFMGDFCPLGRIEEVCRRGDTAKVLGDYRKDFENKDLSIANLECPLTTSETAIAKDGPNIKAEPVAVNMALEIGIDVLSLGNNHIMDYGQEGLVETINVLDENRIPHLGAGLNVNEARKPLIVDKKGVRIAFLSFCETEFNIGSPTKAGCAPIEIHGVCEAICKAKKEADLVIPLFHCGSEHYPLPSPRIKRQCRVFADCGAAAVICHHTHTVEGFEVYKDVPIFYGLANFVFGYRRKKRKRRPHWNEGLMARIDFNAKGAVAFGLIPYFFDAEEIQFKRLQEDRRRVFFNRLELLNRIIEDDNKLESLWKEYSLRRYRNWYSSTLKKARLYFWRNKARRDMTLWHNRANESHNDVIVTALDARRRGKTEQDEGMKALLEDLIGRETTVMKIKRMIKAWI